MAGWGCSIPWGACDSYHGMPLQAAEKVVEGARSTPQALKRGHIFNDLTARLNSLRKKSILDAQPLKGPLNSKDLRYR